MPASLAATQTPPRRPGAGRAGLQAPAGTAERAAWPGQEPPRPARAAVSHFARTKIQPPRVRTGALIERPALEARFAQALQSHRLVLLCAPAGYGKSSLLARQIEQLPADTALAWISCDADDSPVQLLECLAAALEPFDLPWRTDPDALIAAAAQASTREARRQLVAEVINALDACDVPHGIIAVDDLHRVRHGLVYQFLELLLERFSPRWTLVISTREEPPLPLARLRAGGEQADFRASDLRFSTDETRTLAARAGLDGEAAAWLHTRTEGWPVGLRLALDMHRGGGPVMGPGSRLIDRRVFDFLAAEVLDRMDPALREFLLACAVLPELTAARCAAVTHDEHAAQRLDEIDRLGLFVTPLDVAEPTWRLHDLFRLALEQRLRRQHPGRLPRLLADAAASEPDPVRRIGYLLQAQDWPRAAAELCEQAPGMLTRGATATVQHLLERFPPEQVQSLPDALMAAAVHAWARWDWPCMQASAHRAAAAYRQAGKPVDALAAAAYELIALRGGAQRQACLSAAGALRAACAALPPEDDSGLPRLTGNEPCYTARALLALDETWDAFDQGRLDELPGHLQAQLALLDRSSGADGLFRSLPLPMHAGMAGMNAPLQQYVHMVLARTDQLPGELRTLARGLLGATQLWAGDLQAALTELLEAADEVRWRDHPLRLTLYVQTPLNLVHALRGDRTALRAAAAPFVERLRRQASQGALAQRLRFECLTLARGFIAAACPEDARELLLGLPWPVDALERPVFAAQRRAVDGYRALLAGDEAASLRLFEPLLADAAMDCFGLRSELRLRVAAGQLAQGQGSAAAHTLAPLFTRHAQDADVAALWLVGPALLQTLADAPWGTRLPAEHQRQLHLWAGRCAAVRLPSSPEAVQGAAPAPPAAETASGALSPREFDVLQRLAAGDSNKLIARALDLSPHTVKRHVANILDKLGLNSRGQAAAWYHAQA
jgi:LuxR family transcriptional regulator, maltose regulon positive regulatory protein